MTRLAAMMTSWLRRERLASGNSALWPVLLVLIFVSLATLYAGIVPPFEGPDSGAHFRYIAYLRQHRDLPSISPQTAGISHELVLQPPLYYALAAILTPDRAIEPALHMEAVNPYYGLGLSRRATVTEPGAPAFAWALWIARGVALIGGLLAVVGTWLLIREWLPGSPWAALALAVIWVMRSLPGALDGWQPDGQRPG